jgi:hypothetical protein
MERVMASLLNSFAKRDNVEVTLLLIGKSPKIDFDISDNIEIFFPNFEFKSNQRFLSTLKTIKFLKQMIQTFRYIQGLSFTNKHKQRKHCSNRWKTYKN